MELSKAPKLTHRQQEVLTVISQFIDENGESPTINELAELLDVSSLRTVTQYLESLERKGLISRTRYQSRNIKLRHGYGTSMAVMLPVVGSMSCGGLTVYAEPVFDEYIRVDRRFLHGRHSDNTVLIRAMGSSMMDAGVSDGDLVVTEKTTEANSGDKVVAIIDDKAVLKQIHFTDNAVILLPMSHDPIHTTIVLNEDFEIFGKMVDVIKNFSTHEIEYIPEQN